MTRDNIVYKLKTKSWVQIKESAFLDVRRRNFKIYTIVFDISIEVFGG
jgi:hypothetical protein